VNCLIPKYLQAVQKQAVLTAAAAKTTGELFNA
jgi:hypothetical protein